MELKETLCTSRMNFFVDLNRAALRYFHKAGDQGHSSALLHIGVMYFHGIGIPEEAPEYTKAMKYFRLATEHGNINAHCNLAVMYKNGLGTER